MVIGKPFLNTNVILKATTLDLLFMENVSIQYTHDAHTPHNVQGHSTPSGNLLQGQPMKKKTFKYIKVINSWMKLNKISKFKRLNNLCSISEI